MNETNAIEDVEVGDMVIGLPEANQHYTITQENWQGYVIRLFHSDGEMEIAENQNDPEGFIVSKEHFAILEKKAKITQPQPTEPMTKMEEAALEFRMATEPLSKFQVKAELIFEIEALDEQHAKRLAEQKYHDATRQSTSYMPNIVPTMVIKV